MAGLFFLIGWSLLGWAFLLQRRLMKYLRASLPSRWEYVTTNAFGPGMRNSKQLFAYLFNDQDMDDATIKGIKLLLRKHILYGATSLVAGIMTFAVITVLRAVGTNQ